jgi:hypothetical protein
MLRWLRRHYPARTPIVVRVVKRQPGLHGLCILGEGRALIRITAASESMMLDTLLEEYCHVLRHDCPLPAKEDHDALFWAILGEVTTTWRGE